MVYYILLINYCQFLQIKKRIQQIRHSKILYILRSITRRIVIFCTTSVNYLIHTRKEHTRKEHAHAHAYYMKKM